MSEQHDSGQGSPARASSGRRLDQPQAMAALRDRTDEIELIISGVTTFALFSLPGWIFDRFAELYTHLSIMMLVGGGTVLVIGTGLCYGLGVCFLFHLLTRAYWVGLIGLRTVFPEGIDWRRTPGIGPITREHYQRMVPDLAGAIERSDRLASSLFAVISMIALIVLWIGVLMLVISVTGGLIGAQFGMTNRGINLSNLILIGLLVGLPLTRWVLDAVIGKRIEYFRESRGFRGLVGVLNRLTGWIFPHRLVLPVQLTLQSNTRPIVFVVVLAIGMVTMIVVGQTSLRASMQFTVSGEFTYMPTAQVARGMRAAHYEDLRSAKDRLRPFPMVNSFEQNGSHLRLFLPYHPLRDNPILDSTCRTADDDGRVDCLRGLWAVSLNGEPVDLQGMIPTERGDLRMRGLTAWIALEGIAPGIQTLNVTWNPDATEGAAPVDDRYSDARLNYNIPFLFVPAYEMDLDEETFRTRVPPPP